MESSIQQGVKSPIQSSTSGSTFYRKFMGPESLVFDVGANIGNKTETFASIARNVVAFEPVAECVRILCERFRGNSKVAIVPVALGAKMGEMDMDVGDSPNISTLSHEWKRAVTLTKRFGGTAWRRKQHVKVSTLDEMIERLGEPEFIKIDVEGYEDQVMMGLSSPVKALCFEFTPEHLSALRVAYQEQRHVRR